MLECLLWRERPDLVEWVEESLVFPRETSPNAPGRVSLARQPFAREVLHAFLDSKVEHLYLVFAAQTMKTTLCILGLACLLEFEPAPLLWALPSDTLAKPFSRNRLQPFIRKNPVLAKHLREDPAAFSPMEMMLDVMPVYMTGATSPARLSSRPVAYAIIDEEAKIEHQDKKEAHPVQLIEERTKAFARKLIVHASTPNTEDSPFWQGYRGTDCREFYVPCPHCGVMQTLFFSRETVVWEAVEGKSAAEAAELTARYVCPFCHGEIWDEQKVVLMQKGKWRATNPAAPPSRRGYRLNALYSPFVTFGQMAARSRLSREFASQSRRRLRRRPARDGGATNRSRIGPPRSEGDDSAVFFQKCDAKPGKYRKRRNPDTACRRA